MNCKPGYLMFVNAYSSAFGGKERFLLIIFAGLFGTGFLILED